MLTEVFIILFIIIVVGPLHSGYVAASALNKSGPVEPEGILSDLEISMGRVLVDEVASGGNPSGFCWCILCQDILASYSAGIVLCTILM